MINKTIQKIKETSDAIASIAKSFAAIIASAIACITASITGYIEIKKLTAQALITRAETKKVKEELRTHGPRHTSITTEVVGTPSPLLQSNYQIDINTGIFAISVVVLPLIWYISSKKKKEKS